MRRFSGTSLIRRSGLVFLVSVVASLAFAPAPGYAQGDLLAKPMNTEAEAWMLLRRMRAASAELQTLIQQHTLVSRRLSIREQAYQKKALTVIGTVKEDLDAEIIKWEKKLLSVGDDAQLANIDLQNMLQRQTQTLQTISTVSMLHDTAMAIIRKIG